MEIEKQHIKITNPIKLGFGIGVGFSLAVGLGYIIIGIISAIFFLMIPI